MKREVLRQLHSNVHGSIRTTVLVAVAVGVVSFGAGVVAAEKLEPVKTVWSNVVEPLYTFGTQRNSNEKSNESSESPDEHNQYSGVSQAAEQLFTFASQELPTPTVEVKDLLTTFSYTEKNKITLAPAQEVQQLMGSLHEVVEKKITVSGVEAKKITTTLQNNETEEYLLIPVEDKVLIVGGGKKFLRLVEEDIQLKDE